MSRRRPVDLAIVRAERERLAELAHVHPEAFDRLPTTPKELESVLDHDAKQKRVGRPPSPDPMVVIPARLNRSTVELLDAVLGVKRQERPELTRQDLLREAVGRFLAAERRMGTPR